MVMHLSWLRDLPLRSAPFLATFCALLLSSPGCGDSSESDGGTGDTTCDEEGGSFSSSGTATGFSDSGDGGTSEGGDPCIVEVYDGEACMASAWVLTCETFGLTPEAGMCQDSVPGYREGSGSFSCVGLARPTANDFTNGCATGFHAPAELDVSIAYLNQDQCCWRYTHVEDICAGETGDTTETGGADEAGDSTGDTSGG